MIRLLRYEFQRKWKMTGGIMVLYFLIYFAFLFKFNNDIKDAMASLNLGNFDLDVLITEFGFRFIFFILLASGFFFVSIIGAVNNMRLEAKNATRDLYFSIPISAYSKVGSKVIVSVLEVGVAGLVGFASVIYAFEYLSKFKIWHFFWDGISQAPLDGLIFVILTQLTTMVFNIVLVYLSFAIFRSFFSQVRFGWLVTLVIYGVLNYVVWRAFGEFITVIDDTTVTETLSWIYLAGYMVLTGLVFTLTGFPFEKRVSLD